MDKPIDFELKENYIYKFVPFSINTLKLLIKGQFWLGEPKNLNDPFEGEFTIHSDSHLPAIEALEEFYTKDLDYPADEAKAILEKVKEDPSEFYYHISLMMKLRNQYHGISCFSKRINNILMWSHYADSHKGICLIFDKVELMQELQKKYPGIELIDITYNEILPTVTIKSDGNTIHINTSSNLLLSKHACWGYEMELRLFHKFEEGKEDRLISFPKSSLKGVIVGEKVRKHALDDFHTLYFLLENDSSYLVKWGQAVKDLNKLEMTILEITED
jgi:hypothetical protein